MRIPKKVCVGPGQWFPVKEASLEKGLGFFDPKEETIYVETDQPEAGKFSILFHEMMHIADIKNKQGDAYKKGLTETQVTYLSGCLFQMMARSGLIKGVTPEMMKELEGVEGA